MKIKLKSITGKILLSYLLIVICSTAITSLSFHSILYGDLERRTRISLTRQAFDIAFSLAANREDAPVVSEGQRHRQIYGFFSYGAFNYRPVESHYLILDAEDVIVYSNTPEYFPPGSILSSLSASQNLKYINMENRSEHGQGGTLLAARALIGQPGSLQGSVITFAETNALEALNREILMLLLKSLLIAMAIALPVAILLGRYLIRPLNSLREYARAIARRRFDARLDLESDSELAELASTFNDMAYQLERYDLSLRRFFQSSSHEIKTPLMSIQGFAEGIRDGVFAGEQADQALETISRECQRLKTLLDEMINASKQESQREAYRVLPCDLSEILPQVAESFQGYAVEEKIEIFLDLPDKLQVAGNPEKLRRLFGNLLANAIRHAQNKVCIRATKEAGSDGYIKVAVQDDGKGFSDQDLEKAFDYLYKGVNGSTGLGLSIARLIAEEMNGSISIRNGSEEGAVVEVQFPY